MKNLLASFLGNTAMFGGRHLFLLGIYVVLIVVASIFCTKLKYSKIVKIMFAIGMITEIVKVITYTVMNEDVTYLVQTALDESGNPIFKEVAYGGHLSKADLPFHLCSIQIIFFLILSITKNEKIKRNLLSFMLPTCLIGGAMALLLATSSSRGNVIIGIQYFTFHSAIVVFAIYLLRSKEIKFEFKDYIHCLIFLSVVGWLALYLNAMLWDGINNVNYMYVINPPADNLPILNKDHGWLVYFISYIGVCVFFISAVYCVPIYKKIRSLIKENKKGESIAEPETANGKNKTEE